jgi:hypothetical protein
MVEYLGHNRPFASIKKGLDYLNSDCTKQHNQLFDKFVEDWNRISEEGLWDKLQSIINTRLKEHQDSPEKNVQPDSKRHS